MKANIARRNRRNKKARADRNLFDGAVKRYECKIIKPDGRVTVLTPAEQIHRGESLSRGIKKKHGARLFNKVNGRNTFNRISKEKADKLKELDEWRGSR